MDMDHAERVESQGSGCLQHQGGLGVIKVVHPTGNSASQTSSHGICPFYLVFPSSRASEPEEIAGDGDEPARGALGVRPCGFIEAIGGLPGMDFVIDTVSIRSLQPKRRRPCARFLVIELAI